MDKVSNNKANILHCNLTQLQEEYLPAIEWLLDVNSYRAQGRTYTMAVAFIKIAMKRPGMPVRVRDHHSVPNGGFNPEQRRMMQLIEGILRLPENEEILKRTYFNHRDGIIRIEGFWPKEIVAEWIGPKDGYFPEY